MKATEASAHEPTVVSLTYRRGHETVRPWTVSTSPCGPGSSPSCWGRRAATSPHCCIGWVGWTDRLAAWRRTHVGFVFQSFHLLAHSTAVENVALPLALGGLAAGARAGGRANSWSGWGCPTAPDTGQANGRAARRSGWLWRGRLRPIQPLWADEPTGNPDSQGGAAVFDLFVDPAHLDGRTVVVVSHNVEFVALADRVIPVRDGRVVADSDPGPGTNLTRAAVPTPGGAPAPTLLLGMAASAVRRRLGRSLLTGAGAAIGVTAMVLPVWIEAGLRQRIVAGVLAQALTSVMVTPSPVPSGISFAPVVAQASGQPLGPTRVRRLVRLAGVCAAYPSASLLGAVRDGARSTNVVVQPLPPSRLWQPTGTVTLPHVLVGGLPAGHAAVVVLTQSAADALFAVRREAQASVLGRKRSLKVSGILGPGGQLGSLGGGARRAQALVVTGGGRNVLGSPAAYVRSRALVHWLAGGRRRPRRCGIRTWSWHAGRPTSLPSPIGCGRWGSGRPRAETSCAPRPGRSRWWGLGSARRAASRWRWPV